MFGSRISRIRFSCPEHPVATKLGATANADGVFITEPRLSELIAEAVQKAGRRIIVTVVAPEESKAREAIRATIA